MEDDMEQRVHDLENAQSSLQAQLDTKTARVAELEASNFQLQGRLDETSAHLEREKAEKQAAQEGAREAVREREQKEAAIRTVDELRRAATKQGESYDALDEEFDNLRGKLRQAERARGDAMDETELKAREVASVNRRASSLQNQCADLERELDERTKALSTYRGEKTQELMAAMTRTTVATQRADAAEAKATAIQRTVDSLQARLVRVESELNAVLRQSAAEKAGLERQLALQTNLTNLQKQKADEAMIKIDHLRNEVRRLEGRVATEMERTVKERKRADEVTDKSKAVVEKLEKKLKEQENQSKRTEDSLWTAPNGQNANGNALAAQSVPLDLSADINSLTDYELKMRMMQMERELETVRSDRDRHALFLTRILREVDHKSPLLMSNKKDYQRILQSHEQLFLKVEDSMRRCQRAEAEREEALSSRDNLSKHLETAKDSLADLGAQLQKLLRDNLERDLGRPLQRKMDKSRLGTGSAGAKAAGDSAAMVSGGGNVVPQDPEQLIADHLVTFEDVRQMQERNRMLVQVARRLTVELKDTKIARNLEQEAHQSKMVDELQRELDELREARERQLEMLETVTSARDMYRLLLAQETNKDISRAANGEGDGASSRISASAAQEMEATKSRVHELERDLGVARDEAHKLHESMKHLADDVTAAERAQSKAQAELAATQRMLSHAEDRVKSLAEDRDTRSSAIARETEKFQKLSDNIITLQGHLERQKNEAVTAQNEAKDLALTNQALRADKRIIEESEKRLRDENVSLRKESRSKNTLLDNLASRDRSVGVQKDAEISTLRDELNRLRREAEKDRRAATDAEMAKQKAAALLKETERELQTTRSTLQAEVDSARAAADRAIEAERDASKRSVELAARLQEARARLVTEGSGGSNNRRGGDGGKGGSGSGSGSGNSADPGSANSPSAAVSEEGMSNQLAEIRKLTLDLQATKAELKAKEGALATSERQRVQYEAIGTSRQQQMVQLTAAKKRVEEELMARTKDAEARAVAAEAEVRSTKTGLASTVAGLVKDKEASDKESAAAQEAAAKLRDELEAARREAELERSRVDDYKKEVEVQQKTARAAEERYRHELEAHAGAITALRQAEDAQDKSNQEKRDAENAKDALAADLMRARAEWEAHEASFKKAYEETEERLSSSKSENNVLHEHLYTLNQQLEAAEEKRQEADKAMADSVVAGGGNTGGGASDDPERLRLARSVKELHELVRHKQRDVQVVTMNLEMSTQKVSTLEAELDRAKLSLREAREEVQKAARDSVDAVSKTEQRKLLEEVAQVSTLRESNIMLRNSLREAEDRSRLANERAKELERKSAPLQQAERRHAAAAAALASDKASLRREVDSWKKRVSSLTASFNAVDPKEHQEVVEEKNKLQKALAEAEKAKGVLEASKAELMRAKAAAEKERDDINAVKSRLASQAAAIRDLEAKLSAEKERCSKSATEALSAKQEALRVRNGMSVAVKQLNDQLAKAKSEAEALKVQLRHSHAKDSGPQEAATRKKILEMEEKMAAVERESTTNRNMYDNMKKVNRNMKETLENYQQQLRDKEEELVKIQGRISELEKGQSSQKPQGAPSTPALAPAPASAAPAPVADATAATDAAAVRLPTRSVSPTPHPGRALLPVASARADPSAPMAVDGVGTGGIGEGGDGGESALRTRLMARSKRPLAPTPEASGAAKRTHKPSDEPTSFAPVAVAAPVSTSTSATTSAAISFTTPLTVDAAMPAASSNQTSTITIRSTTVSAPSASPPGISSWIATSTKPGFGVPYSTTAIITSKLADAPGVAPETSGLNPAAIPFGLSAGGWGGPLRLAAGTVALPPSPSPSAPTPSAAATSISASASPAPAAPSTFGDMSGWGTGRRPAGSIPASSVSTSSAAVPSSPAAALTPAALAASAVGGVGEAGAGGVSGAWAAGRGKGEGNGGLGTGKASVVPPGPGGAFGSGKGFTGFGGPGRFGGTNVASMKPPSKDAQFPIFPKINLPVPSGTKSSGAGVPFPPPASTSAATPTFSVPAPAGGASTLQQQQSPFGSGSGSQLKFGLGPASAASYASGVPTFGSGVPAFGIPASPASALASASPSITTTSITSTNVTSSGTRASEGQASTSAAAVGSSDETNIRGNVGGGSSDAVPTGTADSAEAAAAGMPGPGALMLDVEARRAAREKRFATQPLGVASGSNQATVTAPVAATSSPGTAAAAAAGSASTVASKAGGSDVSENAAQAQREDGEMDEEDEGDPV